jgi:hypothetical protein
MGCRHNWPSKSVEDNDFTYLGVGGGNNSWSNLVAYFKIAHHQMGDNSGVSKQTHYGQSPL